MQKNVFGTNCNVNSCLESAEVRRLNSAEIEATLKLLHEAELYARDANQDAWQFAVEIEQLRRTGITESALRWLVCKGFVRHADEVTRLGDAHRKFRAIGTFCLTKSVCFIINKAGTATTASNTTWCDSGVANVSCNPSRIIDGNGNGHTRNHREVLPLWDAIRHELRLGETLVKRFKHPSRNQQAILATFQEEGWPYKVDDPLSPTEDGDPKRRLNDTIKGLNHHQANALIKFRGDGTGEAVVWEAFVAEPSIRMPLVS
jgi:hypothetical protein